MVWTVDQITTNEMADDWNNLNLSFSNCCGRVLAKVESNTNNVNILVCGDSTGNSSVEWVYYLAEWYYSQFPQFTVNYILWNDATGDYNSSTVIGVGSGSYSINIYNVSVSGSKPDYILGSRFDNAVKNIPSCDLFILNHGHNMVNSYSSSNVSLGRVPQVLEAALSIHQIHEGAGVMFVAQNPRRDDDTYQIMYETLTDAAGLLGADIADVYSEFINENKNPDLYADNIHPSTGLGNTGTQIFLDKVKNLHITKNASSYRNPLNTLNGYNLLSNGNFSSFDNTTPDSWIESNATTTKDSVIFDGLNGYSVDLAPTTSGSQSYISQNLPSNILQFVRGEWLTLAARVYVPSGQPSTTARVALTCQSVSTNTYTISDDQDSGWVWRIVSTKVGINDSYVTARLYGDTSANNGACKFDRVVLVRGRLPFDSL